MTSGDDRTDYIYDLIYFNNGKEYAHAKARLQAAFPKAKIKDASDEVHEYRLSFEMEIPRAQYYEWLIREELYLGSLWFQMDVIEGTIKAVRP